MVNKRINTHLFGQRCRSSIHQGHLPFAAPSCQNRPPLGQRRRGCSVLLRVCARMMNLCRFLNNFSQVVEAVKLAVSLALATSRAFSCTIVVVIGMTKPRSSFTQMTITRSSSADTMVATPRLRASYFSACTGDAHTRSSVTLYRIHWYIIFLRLSNLLQAKFG